MDFINVQNIQETQVLLQREVMLESSRPLKLFAADKAIWSAFTKWKYVTHLSNNTADKEDHLHPLL